MYEDRILNPALMEKIMSPEEAAALIKPDMTLGFSGFTSAGYAKKVPTAIAKLGTAKNLTVITGASTGKELDGELARAGLMGRRHPFQSDKDSRNSINAGDTRYADIHLSVLPRQVRQGVFGEMDYTIVECAMITEKGLVPTLTVGATNALVENSKKVIVELNTSVPKEVYGMHDIISPDEGKPVPITKPTDRVGLPYIPCEAEKIAAIVINEEVGATPVFKEPDEVSSKIAEHIVEFLKDEVKKGHLPENLYPLQSGVGAVANAVLAGLSGAGFKHLSMYTEVGQDSAVDLVHAGIMDSLSTTAISLSKEGLEKFYANFDKMKEKIVLRPQDVSNHPEMVRRLNVIAMNTAIEADIYGNVNSTHIIGTKMMNGVGGSGDFARNAAISIFMTPSLAKDGKISSIVSMVTHVDSCEHDVCVLVTEEGLADLRGLSPKERAELIIEKCAHPSYKKQLREYFEKAKEVSASQHTPHDLAHCFDMHNRYLETGSMME
ncbi:MAG: succinate CoA transferase [Lachnospiraceae bacterium]|nr:succinate CoA transferase [Lachnospiraceae bacterium]